MGYIWAGYRSGGEEQLQFGTIPEASSWSTFSENTEDPCVSLASALTDYVTLGKSFSLSGSWMPI